MSRDLHFLSLSLCAVIPRERIEFALVLLLFFAAIRSAAKNPSSFFALSFRGPILAAVRNVAGVRTGGLQPAIFVFRFVIPSERRFAAQAAKPRRGISLRFLPRLSFRLTLRHHSAQLFKPGAASLCASQQCVRAAIQHSGNPGGPILAAVRNVAASVAAGFSPPSSSSALSFRASDVSRPKPRNRDEESLFAFCNCLRGSKTSPGNCVYIFSGAVIPSSPNTITSCSRTNCVSRSRNALRSASSSERIWCLW